MCSHKIVWFLKGNENDEKCVCSAWYDAFTVETTTTTKSIES